MSNTVQFLVKDITNPTVTHADKLINAIVTCINAVCNFGNVKNKNNIHDLNQLLEATKQTVKRNKDKATKEITEPSSTNSDNSVEHNGNKATEEATEPSTANLDKPSLNTNSFKQTSWSMRHIQKKMLRVLRVDTSPQATREAQPSPRVDGSNKAKKTTSKSGSSAKKAESSKSKVSQIKSKSSPATFKLAKPKTGRAAKTPKSTPNKVNSPTTNKRSKSGPPSANTRSQYKLKRLPDRCRLTKQIARIKNEVHEAMTVVNRDTGKILKYR